MEIWSYIIKVSALMLLFFLTYNFLLKKETFFQANRWFLLVGLLLASLIPLISITKTVWHEPVITPKIQDVALTNGENLIKVSSEGLTATSSGIDWLQIFFLVYAVGVVVMSFRFLWRGFSLWNMLHKLPYKKMDGFRIIDNEKIDAPFSFFRYIGYNSKAYSSSELEDIIEHEKVHSIQKHSIDVLLSEIFCVIFWFNPLVWIYKKAILQNLEFLADNTAIKSAEDKKQYQKTLLKVTLSTQNVALTNAFYQPLIKKRIMMLNKAKSKQVRLWRYSIILPILLIFVMQFQTKVVARTLPSSSLKNNETLHQNLKDENDIINQDSTVTSKVAYTSFAMTKKMPKDKLPFELNTVKDLKIYVIENFQFGMKARQELFADNPLVVVDNEVKNRDSDPIKLEKELKIQLLAGKVAKEKFGELANNGAIVVESSPVPFAEEEDWEEDEKISEAEVETAYKKHDDKKDSKSNESVIEESDMLNNEEYSGFLTENPLDERISDLESFNLNDFESAAEVMEHMRLQMAEMRENMSNMYEQYFSQMFDEGMDVDSFIRNAEEQFGAQHNESSIPQFLFSFDSDNLENGGLSDEVIVEMDKNNTDEDINALKDILETYGIDMQISRLKRNGKGEIYQIKIELTASSNSELGSSTSKTQSFIQRNKNNPIGVLSIGKIDGRLFVNNN